jgi:hypothetical protein
MKLTLKCDVGTDIRAEAMEPPELLYPTLSKLRKESEQCKSISVKPSSFETFP